MRPVFVVGCCNSGTTVLWKSLLAHPALSGPPCEGQDLESMPTCMRHFLGRETSRLFAHPRFQGAYRMTEADHNTSRAAGIRAALAPFRAPGKRILEKSPANSMRTRFIQSVFPEASFVAMVRDGRAVAEGIRRKRSFDPERPHLAGLETTLEDASVQWVCANRQLLEDAPFLRRVRFVRYEELVEEPARVLGSVLDFLGLERRRLNAVNFQVGLNKIQVSRLTDEERQGVERMCAGMLAELGYGSLRHLEGAAP